MNSRMKKAIIIAVENVLVVLKEIEEKFCIIQ